VYPLEGDLLEFAIGQASSHQYFIDTRSISIGPNEIAYYTVVIRAGGGAVNVSHEGLRCKPAQKRLYALGHADKRWVRAKRSEWTEIRLTNPTEYQATLHRDAFCPQRVDVRNRDDAIRALRAASRQDPV
jgi:hypothetical protein